MADDPFPGFTTKSQRALEAFADGKWHGWGNFPPYVGYKTIALMTAKGILECSKSGNRWRLGEQSNDLGDLWLE